MSQDRKYGTKNSNYRPGTTTPGYAQKALEKKMEKSTQRKSNLLDEYKKLMRKKPEENQGVG